MHLEEAPVEYDETAYGSIVVVDMVGYSTPARMLEENMGAHAVADLNRQIQEFFQSSLRHIDKSSAYTRISDTGDGTILRFDAAHDAHIFAEQLHRNTEKYNRSRNEPSAMRWFRIGISSGELNREKLLMEKRSTLASRSRTRDVLRLLQKPVRSLSIAKHLQYCRRVIVPPMVPRLWFAASGTRFSVRGGTK